MLQGFFLFFFYFCRRPSHSVSALVGVLAVLAARHHRGQRIRPPIGCIESVPNKQTQSITQAPLGLQWIQLACCRAAAANPHTRLKMHKSALECHSFILFAEI